jgi:hypothetical protein
MRSLTYVLAVVLSASVWTQPRNAGLVNAQDAKLDDKELADRKRAMNQLKSLGIAMHAYHDTNRTFPPAAVVSKEGKPLLSWRVLLLPYVEEAKLFGEFKLEEPWDSPHNKKLLARRPKVYAPVRNDAAAEATYYQVFHGPAAAFEGHRPLRIPSFTDGTSNTILIAEGAEAVPWTKPADLSYDPKKPLPKVGAMFKDVFLAGLADGSVRALKKTVPEKTLRVLITRNAGDFAPLDD